MLQQPGDPTIIQKILKICILFREEGCTPARLTPQSAHEVFEMGYTETIIVIL